MRGVDRLVEAVQAVIEWEVEYREMNHLGTWPPRVFQEMAIARAAILSSTSEPGLPHGILCQCPKCLPSSGGTPVSKLLEVVCPACGYDFPPRVANYPNAHCPNCRHDFNYAVTNAAPSEPQASEPPKPEYQDATIYFDEVPEQGSNRAMIYIWPKPQPESVSAQGNKQVFMCGCISYNTALVPRCPIHKQASEPPASEGQTCDSVHRGVHCTLPGGHEGQHWCKGTGEAWQDEPLGLAPTPAMQREFARGRKAGLEKAAKFVEGLCAHGKINAAAIR